MQPKYYGAAAEYNKKSFRLDRRLLMFGVLGLIVLVFIAVGFMLVTALTSAPRDDLARLVARESQLQKFVATAQATINNDELSKINSSANLLLLSDTVALKKALAVNFGINEPTAEITAAETDKTSAIKLKEASLVSKYDEVYLELLRAKIAATQELAKKIEAGAGANLKITLQQIVANLASVDEQLAVLQP